MHRQEAVQNKVDCQESRQEAEEAIRKPILDLPVPDVRHIPLNQNAAEESKVMTKAPDERS
jgi:hypothetical protein